MQAQSPLPVPALTSRVVDQAAILRPDQRAALDAQLAAIESQHGAQLAILTVPTTGGEPIEAFGLRVAEAWKLGRAEVDGRRVDDGLIVIVAVQDRRMRIEVGYGLEGAIPDAVARRIIDERMAPRFREGDWFTGLSSAVSAIGALVAGEQLPAPRRADARGADDSWGTYFAVAVFVGWVIGSIAIGALARGLGNTIGRLLGSAAGGAGSGAFAAIVGAGSFGMIATALVTVFLLLVSGRGGPRLRRHGRHTWRSGPPVVSPRSGSWGSSGGRGGFGGGGFSGGGGGFGGGGASGSW